MKLVPYFITYILCQISSGIIYPQCNTAIKGIYRTSDDFINDNLSFLDTSKNNGTKIKLNDFFMKPYISIKQEGKMIKLPKSEVFGYKTCSDKFFRFSNRKEYLLLNPGEQILVYEHIVSKPPMGRTNITNYYFSIGVNEPLQKLTIAKIKAAFPANLKFHQLIDEYFKYNTDLAKGNKINNKYLINRLLQISIT